MFSFPFRQVQSKLQNSRGLECLPCYWHIMKMDITNVRLHFRAQCPRLKDKRIHAVLTDDNIQSEEKENIDGNILLQLEFLKRATHSHAFLHVCFLNASRTLERLASALRYIHILSKERDNVDAQLLRDVVDSSFTKQRDENEQGAYYKNAKEVFLRLGSFDQQLNKDAPKFHF